MPPGQGRGSKIVFVGNIPYDKTEEQLAEIFSEVGKVVDFRLVFDVETSKPRGYGFCEFEDPETAASAIRNLNNIQVSGRPLRVSSAGEDPKMERQGMHGGVAPQRLAAQQSGAQPMGGPGPQGWGGMQQQQQAPPMQQPGSGGAGIGQGLPPGQPLPPGMQATDAISQTLAALPPSQLLDIMSQMKSFVTTSPDQAKALLNGHPQLAYALFQAMLMMNVVDPAVLQRMMTASAEGAAGAVPLGPAAMGGAPMPGPPQQGGFGGPGPQNMPPQGMMMGGGGPPGMGGNWRPGPPGGGAPARNTPPPAAQHQQGRGPMYGQGAPMPPQAQQMQMGMGMGMPPQSQPGMPAQALGANLGDQQRELLQQVLSLTPEQINALPPDKRDTILQLKAQFSGM